MGRGGGYRIDLFSAPSCERKNTISKLLRKSRMSALAAGRVVRSRSDHERAVTLPCIAVDVIPYPYEIMYNNTRMRRRTTGPCPLSER